MGKKTIYGIRRNCRIAAQIMAGFPRVGYAKRQPYRFKESELYYVYVTFFKAKKPVVWICHEKGANFADAKIESFAHLRRHGEVMWCDLRVALEDENPGNSGVYLMRFYMDRRFRVVGLKRAIRERAPLELPFRNVCKHYFPDYYFQDFKAMVLNETHVASIGGTVKLLTGQELTPIMGMMSHMFYNFNHAKLPESGQRAEPETCSEYEDDGDYDEDEGWVETRLFWIEREPPPVVPQRGEMDDWVDVPF